MDEAVKYIEALHPMLTILSGADDLQLGQDVCFTLQDQVAISAWLADQPEVQAMVIP